MQLGYEAFGTGPLRALVLNDWLCDTSTWLPARPYLDQTNLTWVFADLRGYGRSRGMAGSFNLEESADDVLRLADHLSWDKFALVGHSMSTLITMHLAQHFPNRIQRAVVLTPPPPTGFGGDEGMLAQLKALALADETSQRAALTNMWGDRLSSNWVAYKAGRWRATADPAAVAAYSVMFAKAGLPTPTAPIEVPLLAITGEEDASIMRSEPVTGFLSPLCKHLTVVPFAQCGHYPMQEMPPLLAATVQRFLNAAAPI